MDHGCTLKGGRFYGVWKIFSKIQVFKKSNELSVEGGKPKILPFLLDKLLYQPEAILYGDKGTKVDKGRLVRAIILLIIPETHIDHQNIP